MLTRRAWLGGATALAGSAVRGHAKDRKPNFLFILADDHAGYVLGADGNRQARTPNLDRLASEGTRFASNYCNSPVCTPSRQSIFTSQLPHSAGVTQLSTPLSENKPTLAKQLFHSGYETAVFGKMHFNHPGQPGLHGFKTAITEDIVAKQWNASLGPFTPPTDLKTKPVWRPFKDPARIWLNAEKLPFPRPYEQMKSTWVAAQATQFLQEHHDDPFALWVSFTEPHSPYDFPIGDQNLYDPAQFRVPTVGPEDPAQIPLIFRDLSSQEKQGIIAAYYTSVHYLDRNIGVVLNKLRDLQLDENTLVVYMADHGYSLGQHGRFEKHTCYEPNLRVPLIFRWTDRLKPGQVVNNFTESVDVPATILDLLGAERFEVNQGQSLRPYLEGHKPSQPRDYIFSEYLENEEACIRTSRWKFIHGSGKRARQDGYITDNPTPGRTVRLYDLKEDPSEFKNVAAQYPEAVAELSRRLLARFRTTHPEAQQEPRSLATPDAIEWYLRPRDPQKK